MKRLKYRYHDLQLLKTAEPQLQKAIIKNSNGELVKSISECVLNVLRDNLKLTACQKKRLRTLKFHFTRLQLDECVSQLRKAS
jgi:hypothetical protein